MDPAEAIIRKCGGGNFARGVNLISGWTGVGKSQVYRWPYAKKRGGADGVIPAQHQRKILDRAQRAGISLGPDDFFARPNGKVVPVEPPPKKRRDDDVIVIVAGKRGPIAYLNGERVEIADIKRHIRELERTAA